MGTQGIVSIVINDHVVMKAIAGCNGFNAKVIASVIHRAPELRADIYAFYDLAQRLKFGCTECLVVMDQDTLKTGHGDEIGDSPDDPQRYFDTFADPAFNPRWAPGTADYVEIVYIKRVVIDVGEQDDDPR